MTHLMSLFCLNYFYILTNLILQTQGRVPIDYKNHKWENPSRFRRQLGSMFENCGTPFHSASSLVAGGESVNRGEYPWLVALFLKKDNGTFFQCGASLLSKQHVLTAAHCTVNRNPNDFVLKLGMHNVHDWVDKNVKLVTIKNIQYHPEFESSRMLQRDIAILVMENPIEYSQYIMPVCLWEGNDDLSNVIGQRGTVVGWGRDENGLTTTSEPRKVTIPVVSTDTCRASRYEFHFLTNNMTICAGDRNKSGPCNGDSGGGLYMKKEGRWMIRGIVSNSLKSENGETCNLSEYIIFTDAAKYNQWIKETIDICKSTSCDLSVCKLPERPISGSYSVLGTFSTSPPPGDTVPEHTVLQYSCDDGSINNNTVTVCIKGRWNHKIECRRDPICTTPSNQQGKCVNIKRCQPVFSILTNSPTSLPQTTKQALAPLSCGFEDRVPKVCCVSSDTSEGGLTTPSIVTRDLAQSANYYSEAPPSVDSHPNLRLLSENCGDVINNATTDSSTTGIFEFPWMALIANKDSTTRFLCSGTIINSRYILTAVSCVNGRYGVSYVRVGEHNVATEIDCEEVESQTDDCALPYQDIKVAKVIPHPSYDANDKDHKHDIALIRLEAPIDLTIENVQPICLPIQQKHRNLQLDNKYLIATGWGKIRETGRRSTVLLKNRLPYVANDKCGETYKRFQSSIGFRQICAGGYEVQSSCADGGSPLQSAVPGENKYIQYGILSFGPVPCGRKGYPDVFTRVSHYVKWILDTIEP